MTSPRFDADPPLALRLLGGCRLSVGGSESGLRYDKVRTLLALLAMAKGEPLRREYLAAMLWPNANGEAARRSLRHALHVLREALGPTAAGLQGDRQAAWLSCEGMACDALALSEAHDRYCRGTDAPADASVLEQAAGLYAGAFLAGIDADSGSSLESWLRDQRDAAAARAADLWRELIRLRLAGGMAREGLAAARRLLDLDACDERANLLCMEALAGAHGAQTALAHYAAFCRRLESEWGEAPSATAEAFAARLRDGTPELQTLPERRPITVICLQQLNTDSDDEEEDGGLVFAGLVDAMRQRIGDGSARLVVPHHGLAFVYFGIPLAREDSALAAVRLALDLAVHSGVGKGFVQAVHCDLPTVAAGASEDAGLGPLANAALRLCALGRAGDILASDEAVRWLCRDLHRRGGENFRLIPHPERADLALVRPQARRARPWRDDLELPLVGRRAELAAILHRLRAARRSPGSLALAGEAGLGKTRLALEAAHRVKQYGQAVWLRCNREAMTEPLAPLRGWIGALAGIAPSEPAQRSARKLARLDRRLGTNSLLTRLFASGADEESSTVSMKSRLASLLALAALWKERSGSRLLVVVDDIQWAGQSTRELLEQWLQAAPGCVFTLLLARNEEDVPSGVPVMFLPRLDELHARKLLEQVQPERPLAQREFDAGLRLGEGLPLFLIEFKRHCSGHGRRELSLPRSLHDLLSARLDALPAGLRRLAGCAAIPGNDGGLAELSLLMNTTPAQLAPQLALLAEAGLLYPPAHGRYRFRHQALQRAALERLPRGERRSLHALAAQSLAEHLPPARIARHWEEAEQPGNALLAHLAAGEQALAEGAQREAVSHFDSTLELGFLHGAETVALFSAWLGKGLSITVLEGYSSASAHACFATALDLAMRLDDPVRILQARWGIWLSSSARVGFKGAVQEARPLLELALSHGDDAWICLGHYAMGNNLFWLGRIAEAETHLLHCADLADRPGIRRRIVAMVGEASDLYALGFLAWAAVKRGDRTMAEHSLQRAQTAVQALDNPPSSALVLGVTALAAQMADEPERARQWAARTVAIADPRGYELWLVVAMLVDTWACVRLGESAELAGLETALTGVTSVMPSVAPIFLAPYMDGLARLGRHADALAIFEQAMTMVRRYRSRHELDTLWFLRAACLDQLPGREAEAARSRQRAQRIRACLLSPARVREV